MGEASPATPNVALHGRSGSGKSTVARYLVVQYGYQHAKTGAACRKICQELFGSETKTLMNEVTDSLRKIDSGVWLRAGLAGLQEDRPIVFDSMRFVEDYQFFVARAYLLVDIRAPVDLRVRRLAERGQPFDLSVDEDHPAESELEAFTFDFTIDNTGDLGELWPEIDQMLFRGREWIDARRYRS
jgi:dephospho-CoA kinase